MRIKKIMALGVASCLIFTSTALAAPMTEVEKLPAPKVAAENAELEGVKVSSQDITYVEDYLEIAISYPVISGLTDAKFQEELNYFIEKQVTKAKDDIEVHLQEYVEMAEEGDFEIRPHQLFVEYDVKANNDDFLSIAMTYYTYTGGANGMTVVNAFNINKKANTSFHLKDLFKADVDYKGIINKEIEEQIKLRSDGENEMFFEGEMGFQGIKDEATFYLTDNNLVLFFEKYEIAPGAMGIPEFAISLASLGDILNDISQVVYDRELVIDLKLTKINGIDVIPLREVVEGLGYKVEWNANDQSILVSKANATAKLKIGDDVYIANHKIPYILEAAPVMVDGVTYVPVVFLETVLLESINY